MLEALGVSATAESVYMAMVEHPEDDIDALIARLGLDRTEVVAALDELAGIALIRERPGLGVPQAVSPEVGFSVLMARQQAEMAQRNRQIEESKAAFAMLLAGRAENRSRTPEPGVERLCGLDQIRARLVELAQSCEWEACSFMPGGAQSEENIAGSRILDAEAIERGVHLRTVYQDSVRNHRPTLEYAQWLGEFGSEVRTAATLPLRMLIVDRRLAVVPIDASDSAAAAIVITSAGVVTALTALFNSVWKAAAPLGAPRRRDEDGLSAQERQVLKLLAIGMTDEAIARNMSISVRTARRVASDLHARLSARSRFQAGAKAVTRGWISQDDLD